MAGHLIRFARFCHSRWQLLACAGALRLLGKMHATPILLPHTERIFSRSVRGHWHLAHDRAMLTFASAPRQKVSWTRTADFGGTGGLHEPHQGTTPGTRMSVSRYWADGVFEVGRARRSLSRWIASSTRRTSLSKNVPSRSPRQKVLRFSVLAPA